MEETVIKKELVGRLRELYDNNILKDKDEITILDIIKYLGESINW